MINPWPVMWADLKRSRLGAAALAALIAVAVALGVTISAQERALRQGSARAAEAFDLLVGGPGSQTQLVLTSVYLQPAALPLIEGRLLPELAKDPGVAYAAPIAFGDFYQGAPIVGTTIQFASRNGQLQLASGHWFERLDQVVVGADSRLPLGAQFHPSHGHQAALEDADDDDDDHDHDHAHQHQELSYTVVGRLPRSGTPWDRAILAPVEAVWWLHGLPTGHAGDQPGGDFAGVRLGPPWDGEKLAPVPAIVVKPVGVGDAYRLRASLRTPQTMALFPAEVLVGLYATLGDARDLLALVALVTQGLVVAAVLLAVLASLAGRRHTLAVLRALGASRRFVLVTVWAQVTLIVLAGALAGLALGWVGAWTLSSVFAHQTGVALPVGLAGPEYLMVAALAALGSLLALIPALISYRQPVTPQLRQ